MQPCREGEERVQAALAAVVEVEIHAAEVEEGEVADGVGALDRVGVGGVGREEGRVGGGDEGEGGLVGPEVVGIVWVQGKAGLLGREPGGRDGGVDVGLVDDFGDEEGGCCGGGGGVGGREFGGVDEVRGAGFEEQAEEGRDAVDGVGEEEEGCDGEDDSAAAHFRDSIFRVRSWHGILVGVGCTTTMGFNCRWMS